MKLLSAYEVCIFSQFYRCVFVCVCGVFARTRGYKLRPATKLIQYINAYLQSGQTEKKTYSFVSSIHVYSLLRANGRPWWWRRRSRHNCVTDCRRHRVWCTLQRKCARLAFRAHFVWGDKQSLWKLGHKNVTRNAFPLFARVKGGDLAHNLQLTNRAKRNAPLWRKIQLPCAALYFTKNHIHWETRQIYRVSHICRRYPLQGW